MRNIKFLLEYDGTDFVGWQIQENGRSVQGELENALAQVTQQSVRVVGAGRTDAGVHARGQVANFHTESALSAEQLRRGANALLPEEVRVLSAEEVALEFHARYSARLRCYHYTLVRRPHPLLRRTSWFVLYALEQALLDNCARAVCGRNDFRSFCRNGESKDNTVCTVRSAIWVKQDDILRFEITADRFLHGMVRALVGTMVDVGRGYLTFDEFLKIIDARDRTVAGTSAPAQGLVLESVSYEDSQLSG
jgi:tRNA pseudouridine38-40 synthase